MFYNIHEILIIIIFHFFYSCIAVANGNIFSSMGMVEAVGLVEFYRLVRPCQPPMLL